MENAMLEAALKYASFGWFVFPCIGKDPLPTTHGFHSATRDPKLINFWWGTHPERNIGIATGTDYSGLVVIDIDDKNGKCGSASLRDWEMEHGDLPETVTAISGSGGTHYYFYTDKPFRSKTDIMEGVDIRANGGYIIAPPSIHPVTGHPYMWEGNTDEDNAFMCANVADSMLPLLNLPGRSQSPVSTSGDIPDKFELPEQIGKGARVDTLFRYTCSLMQKIDDRAEIEAIVAQTNAERCNPPLSDDELRKEVFPALKRYATQAEKNASSGIVIGNSPIEKEADHTAAQAPDLPDPISLADVWDHPPDLAPELIEGVLRVGHKMIISGPSKAGKSFLMIELAFALAEGMNWLGNRCTQSKVLYCNMEIDSASFIRRVQKVYAAHGMNHGIHPENIEIWNLRGKAAPITVLAPKIVEKIKDKGYKAVIIDPLYKVMAGDENSNGDTAEMLKGFDLIAEETGASVIYSHHFAKGNGGDRSVIDRGSGAGTFARDPDAIITLTQVDYEDFSDPNVTAWRIEYVLREFANKPPVNVLFRYPLHVIDTDGVLDDAPMITTQLLMQKAKDKAQEKRADKRMSMVEECIAEVPKADESGGFYFNEFLAELIKRNPSTSRSTAQRWLNEAGYQSDQEKGKQTGKPSVWHKKIDANYY